MEILEEMKRGILTELNAYHKTQHGFVRDNEEIESRQLIVHLERMDYSAYEANQKNVSYHLSDLQTNNSESHGTETQHEARDEDVVQLDRIDASLNENDVADHTVLQTNATTLEIDNDVELTYTDADRQSHVVDRSVHETEELRYTYYPVAVAGNHANPTGIFFVPGTNLFGNLPESVGNQSEVILHIPSPEGNQELATNSTTHEIVELRRSSDLGTLNKYVNIIENSETARTDLTLERQRFMSLENTFLEKLQHYMQRKNYTQKLMTKARYWDLIRMTKKTKTKPLLSVKDRNRLKNYDVVTIGESEKLIVPIKDLAAPIIFYVHNEEMFQILIDVHLGFGHIGKQVMKIELNKRYKNFTKDVIAIFLDLCDSCKARTSRVQSSSSNVLERHLNTSRVQVRELIQTQIVENVPEFIGVENFKEMEIRFNEKINQIAKSMVDSIYFMTKSTYYNLIHNIKNIDRNALHQTNKERRLLRRFDVSTISGTETLIAAGELHPIQGGYLKCLHIEELFTAIHKVHITNKHAAKDLMIRLLRIEYMNVAMVAVEEYIRLCRVCQRTEMNSREEIRHNYLESDEMVLDLYTMDKSPHSSLSIPEMNLLFNLRLGELIEFSRCDVLNKHSYSLLIEEVKAAKRKTSKDLRDHHLSCLYDVIKYKGEEILATSFEEYEDTPCIVKHYVYLEQVFCIIHDCHISSGHTSNNIMMAELTKKYQNINTDMVTSYLELCGFCMNKHAAYNRIVITQPPTTFEDDKKENDFTTKPHAQTEHRASLFDTEEEYLEETEDTVDMEDTLIEIISDSSSDVEQLVIKRTDEINASNKLVEIEDNTLDEQSSFSSKQKIGSESIKTGTETEPNEQTKASEIIEHEETDLSIDADARFGVEGGEENKVNYDLPKVVDIDQLKAKLKQKLKCYYRQQTEQRTPLFDTEEEYLGETGDSVDMEDRLIEISSDSSSDVEQLVTKQTDEIHAPNQLVETEDNTLDDQSSFSGKEEIASESIERGTETQPNEQTKASKIIEHEESDLSVDVGERFEVERAEENEVNYDLPKIVDVDQLKAKPETQLKTNNDLLNIKDPRSNGSVLLINSDRGPGTEKPNGRSIVAQEKVLDYQSEVEDSDKVSSENKNPQNRNKTGSNDFQKSDSSGEIDSQLEIEKEVGPSIRGPKYIKDKFLVIKLDRNRETILAVENAKHVHNKKKNKFHEDMEISNVNVGITTPTKDTSKMIEQVSNDRSTPVVGSDAHIFQSTIPAGKGDKTQDNINHKTAEIGQTCIDSDLKDIEVSLDEQFKGQEPLEKGIETGTGLADSEIPSDESTVSDNQTSKCPVTEENQKNDNDANEEISKSFEENTLNLDQPVGRMCTNRKMLTPTEKEAFNQSVNMPSIHPENEDIPFAVKGSGCDLIEKVINAKPENTCKKCKDHQPIAENCMKYRTTDACTQTSKIGAIESEPNETNQNDGSWDNPELQKLEDQSALERKTRFMERLRETKSVNSSVLSKKAYFYLIEQVRKAKSNDSSQLVIDKNRVHNYDVIKSRNTERLVTPVRTGTSMKMYVHIEEVFDIIHSAHIDTNHGGVLSMMKLLRRIYQNITRDMTRIYLETCTVCQRTFDIGSRCQVDIIDMHNHQVDGYSNILVYHHHTNLVQLRPLKSKQVCEVAEAILDIFAIFGVPNILHTSISRRFTSCLVKEICKRWRQIKIIFGKPKPKQANTVKVEDMLACWMKVNTEKKWTDSLRYVQVEINSDQTGLNAHQATFGKPFSFGLRSSLTASLDHVTTEKELERVFYNGDYDSETLSSEDSSEETSDETDESSLSDTLTTDDELMAVSSTYSVVRTKRTKSDDDGSTNKKTKLT